MALETSSRARYLLLLGTSPLVVFRHAQQTSTTRTDLPYGQSVFRGHNWPKYKKHEFAFASYYDARMPAALLPPN